MEQQQRAHWGHRAVKWAAAGFGLGYAPLAPGTVGTLAGIPLYLLLRDLSPPAYGTVVLGLFFAGIWCCQVAERHFGRHDHPSIVWDEIVGYLIAMFHAPFGWEWIVTGFALFRLFDIWKPFPIRRLERLGGGFGVMADDALAGVYALVVMQAVAWLIGADLV